MKIEDVCNYYEKSNSLKATAKQFAISEWSVKKCLVSNGIIQNSLTERISSLINQGKKQCEIADILGISTSCVGAYSPYMRGSYLIPSTTVNAQRIRKCRNKLSGE